MVNNYPIIIVVVFKGYIPLELGSIHK